MEEVAGHDLVDKGSRWLVPSFASLLEKIKTKTKNQRIARMPRDSKLETNLPIRFKQRQ